MTPILHTVGLVAVLLLRPPLCRARLPSASRTSAGSDGATQLGGLGDDPVPSTKIVSLILDGRDFYEGEQLFLLQSTGRPGEYKAVRHAPSRRALEGISLDDLSTSLNCRFAPAPLAAPLVEPPTD